MIESIVPAHSSKFPDIPRKVVLKTLPSGEIRLDQGADGIYLQFDCDCLDALPYCQAQCCALRGVEVLADDNEDFDYPVEFDHLLNTFVLKKDADGFCQCLERRTRTCGIYENRPQTCQQFHCTRGVLVRGWKLPNAVRMMSRD